MASNGSNTREQRASHTRKERQKSARRTFSRTFCNTGPCFSSCITKPLVARKTLSSKNAKVPNQYPFRQNSVKFIQNPVTAQFRWGEALPSQFNPNAISA